KDGQQGGSLDAPQAFRVDAAKEHEDAHDRQGTQDENDERDDAADELAQNNLAILKLRREQKLERAFLALAGDDSTKEERHEQEDGPVLHAADRKKQSLGKLGHDANRHFAAFEAPAELLPDDKQGEEQDETVEHAVEVVAFAARHLHHLLGEDGPEKKRQNAQHGPVPLGKNATSSCIWFARLGKGFFTAASAGENCLRSSKPGPRGRPGHERRRWP